MFRSKGNINFVPFVHSFKYLCGKVHVIYEIKVCVLLCEIINYLYKRQHIYLIFCHAKNELQGFLMNAREGGAKFSSCLASSQFYVSKTFFFKSGTHSLSEH